jgi:hypothetical protein
MKILSLSLEKNKHNESDLESKTVSIQSTYKINHKNKSNRSIFTINDGIKLIQSNKTQDEFEKFKNNKKNYINSNCIPYSNKNETKNNDLNLIDINLIKGSSIFKNSIIDNILGTIDDPADKKSRKSNIKFNESNIQPIEDISNCGSSDNYISQTQNLFFKNKIKTVSQYENNNVIKRMTNSCSRIKSEKNQIKKKKKEEKMKIILLNKSKEEKDEIFPIYSTVDSRDELISKNIEKINDKNDSKNNLSVYNRLNNKEKRLKKITTQKVNYSIEKINESIENYPKITRNNSSDKNLYDNELNLNNKPIINFELKNFTNIINSNSSYENNIMMSIPSMNNSKNYNINKSFLHNKEIKFELFRNNYKKYNNDIPKDINSSLHNLNSIFNNTIYKSSFNKFVSNNLKSEYNSKNQNFNIGNSQIITCQNGENTIDNNSSNIQFDAFTQTKIPISPKKNNQQRYNKENKFICNKTSYKFYDEKINNILTKDSKEKYKFYSTMYGIKKDFMNNNNNDFFPLNNIKSQNLKFTNSRELNKNNFKSILNLNKHYFQKTTNEFRVSKYFNNVCYNHDYEIAYREPKCFKNSFSFDSKFNNLGLRNIDKLYRENNINKDLLKNSKILGENYSSNLKKTRTYRDNKLTSNKLKQIKYTKSVKM